MVDPEVPFTNNRGENDIRMTMVQQKISGFFRSMDGAKMFCRIRSYLLTAQKHDVSPTDALQCLFDGKLPAVFFTDVSKPVRYRLRFPVCFKTGNANVQVHKSPTYLFCNISRGLINRPHQLRANQLRTNFRQRIHVIR